MPIPDLEELRRLALATRKDIVRMTTAAGSGHPSTSLSAVEILTVLYFGVLKHDPTNPAWPDRDRFILSKGHGAPLLYSLMARTGYFPSDQLMSLRKLNSPLQGHPEVQRLPGVEASTGSLGQGLSIGVGTALAARVDHKDYRVYVLTGDGELNEGQVWEAVMSAAHFKIDNLTAIVDRNGQQQDGWVKDVLDTEPLVDKWRSFGWHTIDINGHSLEQVLKAFDEAKTVKGKPTAIIARTVKGKGVSFLENNTNAHGVPLKPEQMEQALKEIEQGIQV
jgi:transketolase